MTRKHFEALAHALEKARPEGTWLESRVWEECVHSIANVCESANPLFDRERFVKACEGE